MYEFGGCTILPKFFHDSPNHDFVTIHENTTLNFSRYLPQNSSENSNKKRSTHLISVQFLDFCPKLNAKPKNRKKVITLI